MSSLECEFSYTPEASAVLDQRETDCDRLSSLSSEYGEETPTARPWMLHKYEPFWANRRKK